MSLVEQFLARKKQLVVTGSAAIVGLCSFVLPTKLQLVPQFTSFFLMSFSFGMEVSRWNKLSKLREFDDDAGNRLSKAQLIWTLDQIPESSLFLYEPELQRIATERNNNMYQLQMDYLEHVRRFLQQKKLC